MVLMVMRGDFVFSDFYDRCTWSSTCRGDVRSGWGWGGGVTVLYQDTGDICIAVSVSVSEMSHPCSLINSISTNQFYT